MNKYAASITILDQDGNTVYDRELTQDEIVSELLTKRVVPDFKEGAVIESEEEVEEAPKKRRGRPKKETDKAPKNKRVQKGEKRTCSICHEKGHIAKTCPKDPRFAYKEKPFTSQATRPSKPIEKEGEDDLSDVKVPEEITTDEGTFYRIKDEADIERIWDFVESGLRDYHAISKRLGLNPLAVRDILMNTKP